MLPLSALQPEPRGPSTDSTGGPPAPSEAAGAAPGVSRGACPSIVDVRYAYARRLDQALCHLAHQEARCRRAIGLLARAFMSRQAHQELGFVRLGDYTRERLGLSAREVQSLAQIVHRMEQLPRTAAAFARGELAWTQVRAIVRVAAPATEASWIERARSLTVRALERAVRDESPGTLPAAAIAETADEDDGLIEGEPAVRLRLECPRRVRALWRALVELARRVAGEALPPWQAAEAIAAEGLSGAPPHDAIDHAQARVLSAALRRAASDRAAPLDVSVALRPAAIDRAAPIDLSVAPRRAAIDRTAPTDAIDTIARAPTNGRWRPAGARARSASHPPRRIHACSRRSHRRKASTNALTRAAHFDPSLLLDVALPDLDDLTSGAAHLDAFTLDERLRTAVRLLHTIDWRIGRVLGVLVDAQLFTHRGFPSASAYIDDRLGISRRKAWSLLAVQRAAADAPALADAWRAGELSWVRAATILPVLRPSVQAAWVARAREVTVRRLADEVAWALDQYDLDATAREIAPPPHGSTLVRAPVQFGAPGAPAAVQSDAHPAGADSAVQSGAPANPSGTAAGAPRHRPTDATVTFHGPASVIALVRQAIHAFRRPPEPAWQSFERLLEHARAEWERQPKHRDPIFARDGWRCTVPGCSARRRLHDHHIFFRSRGGGNARTNRITVCAAHHLHGIHEGYVHAEGTAPDRVYWELGLRSGRRPLLRFVGDRYVGMRA